MSGLDAQRAVLSSEFYWFGGPLGAPKVYDSGTSFSAPPSLRRSVASADCFQLDPAEPGADDRTVRYKADGDSWDITFDEA